MLLLDTNLVSELMRARPDPSVLSWIAAQDGMIAAIGRVHGAPVVTRDVRGFEGCGLSLINPWQA